MAARHAAVIFDVDGTLVDSNDAHARAWMRACAEHGITVAYAAVRRAIGMGGDKLMPAVAAIEEDSPQGQAIAGRRGEIFKTEYLPELRAFPQTRELVARLRQDGYALTVASSAKEEELHALLEIARVADLISIRASGDEAGNSKPDPDIVTAALKRSGCSPGASIMIGDTPYDIEASQRAGVRAVALQCGGWTSQDLGGAIAIYRDPMDLLMRYDQSVFVRHRTDDLQASGAA